MISSPRPVGTIMNMYQAVAPRLLATLKVLAMSCWFLLVKEELIRNLMPCLRKCSAARTTPSNAPGQERKSSWTAALLPSSDSETILISAFFIFSQTSSVTSAPLVAMHMRSPSEVPYSASSKMSRRKSGSPPERTTTGLEKSAISFRSFFPSSVVKSPSEEVMSDEQRQWTHFRLHFWVVSQAIHLGMNSSAIIFSTETVLPVYKANFSSCQGFSPGQM